jgi:DUF1009 family protein
MLIRAVATPDVLGIIAGSGVYPLLLAQAARMAGVKKIAAAAFSGETDAKLIEHVDKVEWMRVGQLGRLLNYFESAGVRDAMMAGQISPRNLFDVRPDVRGLVLLAKLKRRNAESIFGAIADELAAIGVTLLPATTFLEKDLAGEGMIAGKNLSRRQQADVRYGFEVAKEISRLDIGQTVVVKNGTVLAVEAFDGSNETIRRGGTLAAKDAVVVKVSKPKQDMRFDVPVIGTETIHVAGEARVSVIAAEAARTLLLDRAAVIDAASRAGISLVGV